MFIDKRPSVKPAVSKREPKINNSFKRIENLLLLRRRGGGGG